MDQSLRRRGVRAQRAPRPVVGASPMTIESGHQSRYRSAQLLVMNTEREHANQLAALKSLLAHGVDGLLIASSGGPTETPTVPTVFFDTIVPGAGTLPSASCFPTRSIWPRRSDSRARLSGARCRPSPTRDCRCAAVASAPASCSRSCDGRSSGRACMTISPRAVRRRRRPSCPSRCCRRLREVADKLRLSRGDEVLEIVRLRGSNGKPLAKLTNYLAETPARAACDDAP